MARCRFQGVALLGVLVAASAALAPGEQTHDEAAAGLMRALPIAPENTAALRKAIADHDYGWAENVLADEARMQPKSQPLLLALANVLFLDGKQLNAAVVLKKAELLGPLDERSRFLLALSYISINRKRLAVPELEQLAQSNPSNAAYPYWLSRLAYRNTRLDLAVKYAETAVRLDPKFVKAYDQLGLCYAGLNRIDDAIAAYRRAIQLSDEQHIQWPWPAMNLGTLLLRLQRLDEAEAALRASLNVDSQFPVAHLRLAKVHEMREHWELAAAELKEASRLDPTYPEPHYALARVYRKLKDAKAAQQELALFAELREQDKRKGITRPD